MRLSRLLVPLALLASVGCVIPSSSSPGALHRLTEYRVAPPDVIRISVRPEPIIVRELTIRPDGRVSFDLVGDLEVEGKSIQEIRAEVEERIKEFIVRPTVTVELVSSESRRYYVLGEVNRPGSYVLVGRVTAVEALAAAAGPRQMASLNGARLVRTVPEASGVYRVRLGDISQGGDPHTNYELRPGDVIYVPPTIMGHIGYALGQLFFPVTVILGSVGGVVSAAL